MDDRLWTLTKCSVKVQLDVMGLPCLTGCGYVYAEAAGSCCECRISAPQAVLPLVTGMPLHDCHRAAHLPLVVLAHSATSHSAALHGHLGSCATPCAPVLHAVSMHMAVI